MPEQFITFASPLEDVESTRRELARANFSQNGQAFTDPAGRIIRITDRKIEISIPHTDVIDEQEQLEFLAGMLGLDVDRFEKVI